MSHNVERATDVHEALLQLAVDQKKLIVDNLNKELSTEKQHSVEMAKSCAETKETLMWLIEEHKNSYAVLTQLKESILECNQSLKSQLIVSEAERGKLVATNATLADHLRQLKETTITRQANIRNELEKANEDLEGVRAQLKDRNELVNSLKKTVHKLHGQHDEQVQIIEAAEREMAQLRADVASMREERDEAKKTAAILRYFPSVNGTEDYSSKSVISSGVTDVSSGVTDVSSNRSGESENLLILSPVMKSRAAQGPRRKSDPNMARKRSLSPGISEPVAKHSRAEK